MDWLAEILEVHTLNDWYNLTFKDYCKFNGKGLLAIYQSSHIKTLCQVYNHTNWLPWKFERLPDGFWKKEENIMSFLDWAGDELKLLELGDWFSITDSEIRVLGGAQILDFHRNMIELLITVYGLNSMSPKFWSKVTPKQWVEPKVLRR
jgi:hypothetical protein